MQNLLKVNSIPPAICLAFLLLFFSCLPNLNRCRLPGESKTREDSPKTGKGREILTVLTVTLVYAIAAFWNLGNRSSPESFIPMTEHSVILQPNANAVPEKLMLFTGVGQGE